MGPDPIPGQNRRQSGEFGIHQPDEGIGHETITVAALVAGAEVFIVPEAGLEAGGGFVQMDGSPLGEGSVAEVPGPGLHGGASRKHGGTGMGADAAQADVVQGRITEGPVQGQAVRAFFAFGLGDQG